MNPYAFVAKLEKRIANAAANQQQHTNKIDSRLNRQRAFGPQQGNEFANAAVATAVGGKPKGRKRVVKKKPAAKKKPVVKKK